MVLKMPYQFTLVHRRLCQRTAWRTIIWWQRGETLAALVGSEVRVHSGVRTAGYRFTAVLVAFRRQDRVYTDTDGPRVNSIAVLIPPTQDKCIHHD